MRIALLVATATFFIALEGVNGAAPESFSVDGTTWTVHKSEDKRVFYFNTATQKSTYKDPRKDTGSDERDRVVVMLAFALPFLLLLLGGGAYLMYLKVYKPEVLKPKKKKAGTAAAAAAKRPASPTKGAKADAAAPASPAVAKQPAPAVATEGATDKKAE